MQWACGSSNQGVESSGQFVGMVAVRKPRAVLAVRWFQRMVWQLQVEPTSWSNRRSTEDSGCDCHSYSATAAGGELRTPPLRAPSPWPCSGPGWNTGVAAAPVATVAVVKEDCGHWSSHRLGVTGFRKGIVCLIVLSVVCRVRLTEPICDLNRSTGWRLDSMSLDILKFLSITGQIWYGKSAGFLLWEQTAIKVQAWAKRDLHGPRGVLEEFQRLLLRLGFTGFTWFHCLTSEAISKNWTLILLAHRVP